MICFSISLKMNFHKMHKQKRPGQKWPGLFALRVLFLHWAASRLFVVFAVFRYGAVRDIKRVKGHREADIGQADGKRSDKRFFRVACVQIDPYVGAQF